MARVTHFHISGENPEQLIEFYQAVFGWHFEQQQAPRPTWYIRATTPGEPGIDGLLHTREHDSRVVNTIEVDDVDAVVASIKDRHGRVLDRRSIPGIGQLALFEDLEGNLFQLRSPTETDR